MTTEFDVQFSQALQSLLAELTYELNDKGQFPDDVRHYTVGMRCLDRLEKVFMETAKAYILSPRKTPFISMLCDKLKLSVAEF